MTPEELFEQYNNLPFYIVKHYYPYTVHSEDLEQEALLALWKACLGYNTSIAQFSTYAFTTIRRCLNRYLQKIQKAYTIEVISLNQDTIYENQTIADLIAAPDKSMDTVELQLSIDSVYDTLSDTEKTIVDGFMSGLNQSGLARQLNCCNATVHNRVRDIREKFKTLL